VADHLQAGRRRILAILHHPHPAALVEVEENRLGDHRLGQHLLYFQVVSNLELSERLGRSQRTWLAGGFALCLGRRLRRHVVFGGRNRLTCRPENSVAEQQAKLAQFEIRRMPERSVEDAPVLVRVDPGDRFLRLAIPTRPIRSGVAVATSGETL